MQMMMIAGPTSRHSKHLSLTCKNTSLKGKVGLLTARIATWRATVTKAGFPNAPDTKQQSDLARAKAEDIPVLMMLRQNGEESKAGEIWRSGGR